MATVLVIDDDRPTQVLYGKVLGRMGLTVRSGYGAAALASAKANPPNLILLDMLQPGHEGAFETVGENILHALRADPATRAVPVIVITAWEEKAAAAMAMGAVECLLKPFSIEVLAHVVERWLAAPEVGR